MTSGHVVAVVLAAGAGSRFGGGKVLVPLEGRPLLDHVRGAIAAAGIERVIVVGPPDGSIRDALVNPDPSRGLSSSVRLGVAAAAAEGADAILVALADQPRLSPHVIRVLLAAEGDVVVPRYADGSNPNPVLLRRPAFGLAELATGDRGLGPVLAGHPERVTSVEVAMTNPDVDTPADLAALAGIRPAPDDVP